MALMVNLNNNEINAKCQCNEKDNIINSDNGTNDVYLGLFARLADWDNHCHSPKCATSANERLICIVR